MDRKRREYRKRSTGPRMIPSFVITVPFFTRLGKREDLAELVRSNFWGFLAHGYKKKFHHRVPRRVRHVVVFSRVSHTGILARGVAVTRDIHGVENRCFSTRRTIRYVGGKEILVVTNRERDRTIRTIRFSGEPSPVIGRNFAIVCGLPEDYSKTKKTSWKTIWKVKNPLSFPPTY